MAVYLEAGFGVANVFEMKLVFTAVYEEGFDGEIALMREIRICLVQLMENIEGGLIIVQGVVHIAEFLKEAERTGSLGKFTDVVDLDIAEAFAGLGVDIGGSKQGRESTGIVSRFFGLSVQAGDFLLLPGLFGSGQRRFRLSDDGPSAAQCQGGGQDGEYIQVKRFHGTQGWPEAGG